MENISLGYLAKEKLGELARKTDLRLSKYWESEISKNFGFEENQKKLIKKVLLHASEHNLRTAKRLRASLVYYGYLLSGKAPGEGIWKVMEGVELVQTALLIHDDFMDEDTLRRGLPTTHEYFAEGDKHYGESMAVNLGDVVLSLGYERVLECGLENDKVAKATKILIRGIVNTAFGQIYDVTLPKLGEITEEMVLAVHRSKTSIYTFQNPLVIGGVLSGVSEEAQDILKEYSHKAGVAFQIKDDVLGMFGNTEKTGKSVDSDLLQGKSTLLVAKTLELGSEKQKKDLLLAWGNKKATSEEKEKAKKAIVESGSLKYSEDKAKIFAEEAVEIADSLRKINLNEEAVSYLKGVAEYILSREI